MLLKPYKEAHKLIQSGGGVVVGGIVLVKEIALYLDVIVRILAMLGEMIVVKFGAFVAALGKHPAVVGYGVAPVLVRRYS